MAVTDPDDPIEATREIWEKNPKKPWLKIPLDIMTITIAAITIGIAVDNTASTLLYSGTLAAAGVCGLAVGVATAIGLRRSPAVSD